MQQALDAIEEIVGAVGIVEAADAGPMLVDHRGLYRGRAALVVRPASTDQTARVLAVCNQAGIGVVPQGGNTGYCGGATPDDSGRQLLLCLGRMDAIREVDAANFSMTVEAGAVLARIQQAAEEAGLFFPLSLGSQGSCQIGGNLATNAGGTAVLKYGNARDLALGLEVVLADGSVLNRLTALRKDNAGYDLKQLFIGSEGTLGVITAAVLKLFPRPVERETAFVAVADPAAACRLLERARRDTGDAVTSFEYLPAQALDLVLAHIPGTRAPLAGGHEHFVLMELATSAPMSLEGIVQNLLSGAMAEGDALDAAVARSGGQRGALWRLRESVPEAQRLAGGSLKHDVSVPTSQVPGFIDEAGAAVRRQVPGVRVCGYGHLGDGNLHYNLLPPPGETLAQFSDRHGAAVSQIVYDLVAGMGGSVCAEHGVGRLKTGLLARTADPAALVSMVAIKTALDPRGILNPGKVLVM